MTTAGRTDRLDWACDVTVGIVALVGLWLWIPEGPYPGDAAAWLAAVSGKDPFLPLSRPLYSGLASLVSRVPLGTLSGRMALFSVLCGVAAAVGVARLVRAWPVVSGDQDRIARRMSGGVAALVLLGTVPFALACSRASPDPLALALGVGAFVSIARGVRCSDGRAWTVGAMLYGLAGAEHPGVFWFAPAVVLAFALEAARRSDPAGRRVSVADLRVAWGRWAVSMLRFGGWFLLGWCSWLGYALFYQGQPAARWLNQSEFGAVLLAMARAYRTEWRQAFPSFGGLLIGALGIAPALYYCLPIVPRGPVQWKAVALDLACAIAAIVLAMFDVVAPRPASMMLPARIWASVAAAFVLGRWSGRWWALGRSARQAGMRWLAALVPVATWVGLTIFNAGVLRSANRQRWTAYAQDVARQAQGFPWLVAEAPEDDIVALVLAEQGGRTRLLSMARLSQPGYMEYIASQLTDGRLKDLARVGGAALLREWFNRPSVESELVTLSAALWRRAGHVPFPLGLVCTRQTPQKKRVADPARLRAVARDLVENYAGLADTSERWPWTSYLNGLVAARVSRALNDMGVWAEDEGHWDEAVELYRAALRVHPNNTSAAVNQLRLCAQHSRELPREEVDRIASLLRRARARGMSEWAAEPIFGEIRRTEPGMLAMDAQGVFSWFPPVAGESDPRRAEAARRLRAARTALRRRDIQTALDELAAAEAEGASAREVQRERLLVEHVAGRTTQALATARSYALSSPDDPELWTLLALLAIHANDRDAMETALDTFRRRAAQWPTYARLAWARLEWHSGNHAAAWRVLEHILRTSPHDVPALELALELAALEGQADQARTYVRRLLELDSNHARANHVLGSLRIAEGDWPAAELALRRSLESERSSLVMNDLAVVLHQRGRTQQALELAREATTLAPNLAPAWDTLGALLLAVGDTNRAVAAWRRAVELEPWRSDARERLERLGAPSIGTAPATP